MQIKKLVTGQLEENCYLAWDDLKKAVIIDPGADFETIISQIDALQLTVETILLTHGHYDHVGAVNELKKYTGAKVMAHTKEQQLLQQPELSLSHYFCPNFPMPEVDSYVDEGDVISVGGICLQVLHTPGHTEGCMCLLGDGVLFSGDTVFYQTIGRWDFPTGNLKKLCASVLQKVFTLPEDTVIYPGHGPQTTVGAEKAHNEVYRWLSI